MKVSKGPEKVLLLLTLFISFGDAAENSGTGTTNEGAGCIVNDNKDKFTCPKGGVLSYYPHTTHDAPPKNPIVDLSFDATAETVSFRVLNPFEDDSHDIYVVSDDPAEPTAFGDTVCHLEPNAGECPSKDLITAKCIDNNSYTVVTVFASGKGADSAAAQMAYVKNELHKCCPLVDPPYTPEYTAAWTYVIHCNCNEAVARRGLRGKTEAQRKIPSLLLLVKLTKEKEKERKLFVPIIIVYRE